MNILAFDTASSSGAVAIMKDGAIIAHTQLNIGLTHSEQLLPAVDDLMQLTGMKMAQFDAIAITAGPGSFTGLRIGFSTAKGMALGLKNRSSRFRRWMCWRKMAPLCAGSSCRS